MAKEKILLVEDAEDILELVRYNLAKEGFQVRCVMSGEEALNAVRQAASDLGPVNTACRINNFLLLLLYENNTAAIRKNSRQLRLVKVGLVG